MEPYVALTVVAALLFALGNALQKYGIARRLRPVRVAALARRPLRFVSRVARSPAWLLGSVVTLIAVGVETQALGEGDLSVVKPLSRIQSVFVLAIGVAFLGERLRRFEWLGLCAMVSGLVLLGTEPGDSLTYVPATGVNVAVALAVAAPAALLLLLADRDPPRFPQELGLGVASGLLFGLGDVMMKMATEVVRTQTGVFDLSQAGSLRALLGTAEFTLSMVASAIAFMVQQLAFSRGRVSLIVPAIGAGGTVLAVVLGFALLREPLAAPRVLGVAVVTLGALLLVGREGNATAPRPRARRRRRQVMELSTADLARAWVALAALGRVSGILLLKVRQARYARTSVAPPSSWRDRCTVPEPYLLGATTLVLAFGAPGSGELSAGGAARLGSAVLLALVAAVLMLWSLKAFPSVSTGHYVLPEHRVVSEGPYGLVRHPLYLAAFLVWFAVALAYESWAALAMTLVYVIPGYWVYMRAEEEMLLAGVGDEYRRYRERVGMLFPRLRKGAG